MNKVCSKCKVEKSVDCFGKNKNTRNGLADWCKDCYSKQCKDWYSKNKERAIKRARSWQDEHVERCRENDKKYKHRRSREDICFKMSILLRSRLKNAVRNGQKAGSAVRDLGCSIEELKAYLESLFQPGMSWENWTKDGWHIDHKLPLSCFDLTDREQVLKACHYTNLQPLWAHDNLSKNNRILADISTP